MPVLDVLLARLKQGHRTVAFPRAAPSLPDRFRGRPVLAGEKCAPGCRACVGVCPTEAITIGGEAPTAGGAAALRIDLGRCLFCGDCTRACESGALQLSSGYSLAARTKAELCSDGGEERLAAAIDARARRLFGHSLHLRQVSAGGCNACEADTNVLGTVVFDLGRFGVQFVASPRHADGLLVTGPVSQNMKLALEKTYEAIPEPKIVIAVGACAISGGPFRDHPEVVGGADAVVPVDLFIPGCPPHPVTILDGLLRLLGRLR